MDCGEDVRKRLPKGAANLARVANKGFIEGWLFDNQENFVETMDMIRTGAPVQWARLYIELHKTGISKESNINININRQQDRENLQALIRTRITTPLPEYTNYEEVPSEKREIPIISKVGEDY